VTEGLKFGCTACGRCCQNKGEVWFNDDEFADLALYMSEPPAQVLERYSEKVTSGWVKVKTEVNDDPTILSRCVFLGDDGKQCSIYAVRPTQCRTYPFWPGLLSNRESWRKESVQSIGTNAAVESRHDRQLLPKNDRMSSEQPYSELVIEEESGVDARYWTPGSGGCEGIEDTNANLISSSVVHNNLELYNAYTKSFPYRDRGDDAQKLIARTATVIVSKRYLSSLLERLLRNMIFSQHSPPRIV
jgi:uncharacterized protein